MATKDYLLPTGKKKQKTFVGFNAISNCDSQYNNINLNQNYLKNSLAIPVKTSNTKRKENENQINKDTKQSKNESTLWNHRSTKSFLNHLELNVKKQSSVKNNLPSNRSTLSLHIAVYEDSVASRDCSDVSQNQIKRNKVQISECNSFHFKNPFEIPRQQADHQMEPEIMQFRSNQGLLNLNVGRRVMNFEQITDAASLGNDKEAQKLLEELCRVNNNISNDALSQLINNSSHNNSLYFATKILTCRIVQNPIKNDPQSMRSLCESLVQLAAHEGRQYSNYVRTQFIKSAVTLAIFNFFGDAVVPDIQGNIVNAFNEGALFQLFNYICTVFKRLGPLTVIEFLDEFLCQVLEEWRLNANLPYDHMLLIKKNLVQFSLWHFVKLAIELGKTVVQSNFNGNEKFAQHLCEFFQRALMFSEDEKNPNSVDKDYCDCYHPPKDFRMYELLDFAFMLKRLIPDDDGLSLQSYIILTRLSYACGKVFGNATEVSKYRKAYKGYLEELLKTTTISQNNLSSILSIFCNYTCVLYNEESFDKSITDFSKYVASVLNQMIPFIARMLEEDDPEIRQVVRNFGQPMKYLSLCMQDDSDICEIFKPVVDAMFSKLFSLEKTLDQSEDCRRTYKTLVTSLTDVSVKFFEEFYPSFVKFPVQDLKALPWYFYEIGEIMRRSFSEDCQMFQDLVKRFYTNSTALETMEDDTVTYQRETENRTKCLEAYYNALNGIPPNFDQLDFLSSSFSILLWWMNKFEMDMEHDRDDLKIHNANLLSSLFSALNHGIKATYSRGTVGSLKKSSNEFVQKLLNEFSPHLVQKLLNNIFTMISRYPNYPNVVDEAMAVIEKMEARKLFADQMIHFLNLVEKENMSNFPQRRKLFEIGAKAACSSTNRDHVQQFVNICLKPYERHPALMATIDPETMIKIIEIFAGFADALIVFPVECYGEKVTQFFIALNHVYPLYQDCPIVVKKILEFVAIAVPSIIFYNVDATNNNLNEITEGIFKFIEVYCQNNVQKWQERDERLIFGNAENQGYEDLIILMQIVKDILSRLVLSLSSFSDDDEIMVIIEHMGSLSLNIFVPLITPFRSSVPDVLKAFSNMLHIIAECNVMSVINFAKDDKNPLFSLFNSILTSSQTPEYISQFVTTLDFILQKHEIIFKNNEMSSWQKFLRYALNPIFNIVITSTKEDPLYTISRNCLFYFVYADMDFFKFFIEKIVTKQVVEFRERIGTAFLLLLSNIDPSVGSINTSQRQFIDNYGLFRREILGILRYNLQDIHLELSKKLH
uniref:Uncharacterized protein n=1 Tax=Panagrolaimus sp. PS1159 TaxID=55785 RepID=A0AC35GWE9_9BILA